jgi:hypothetical protein
MPITRAVASRADGGMLTRARMRRHSLAPPAGAAANPASGAVHPQRLPGAGARGSVIWGKPAT